MDAPPIADSDTQAAESALEKALSEIKTDAQADALIHDLYRRAGERTVNVMPAPAAGTTTDQTAQAATISRAARSSGDARDFIPRVFATAAEQLAAAMPLEGSALDESVLLATNPAAAVGDGKPELEGSRRRLRRALVKRLKPLQAADTSLFLDINQLPHPRWMNASMRALTIVMKRADAMTVGLFLAALRDPRRGAPALAEVLPSLWLSTFIMETPVKKFFRRKRPFIDIVRATVVGRRPSSFSFPSGHSAAAFAGAALLRRHYPRWTAAFYLLAVMVGFSRIYLGAHYPGDVVTGGIGGTILAETSRVLLRRPSHSLAAKIYAVLRGIRWLLR